jgi:hypothetical protein
MPPEETIEQLRDRIASIEKSFNWREIPEDISKAVKEAIEININDDINNLKSRENYLLEQRHIFMKQNFRYVKYRSIDNRNKYTPFYSTIRKLYEETYPINSIDAFKKDLWQVLDFAIAEIEIELYASFKGHFTHFMHDKLNLYCPNQDFYYENIYEFICFLGLINGIEDYKVIGIVENYYDDGMAIPQPYDYNDEVLYITHKTLPNQRIRYYDAWDKFSNDIFERVDLKVKEIARLVKSKYTELELFDLLAIEQLYDESYGPEVSLKNAYSKWYGNLMYNIE